MKMLLLALSSVVASVGHAQGTPAGEAPKVERGRYVEAWRRGQRDHHVLASHGSLVARSHVATSELMTVFHRHLRAGKGKAAFLRAAQKEIRTRFPDPYCWAAFVLTGDPG